MLSKSRLGRPRAGLGRNKHWDVLAAAGCLVFLQETAPGRVFGAPRQSRLPTRKRSVPFAEVGVLP